MTLKDKKLSIKEKKSKGLETPKACFKCAWKGEEKTIAKIKCNNKDAVVMQKDGVWLCYSFSNQILHNKKQKGGEKSERKS